MVLLRKLVPELELVGGGASGVDVGLACRGGATDGKLLERTAKATHGVPLKVGTHEQGIIIFKVATHNGVVNAGMNGGGQDEILGGVGV